MGPMVMAAVCIKSESELPPNIKDSKMLSPKQREKFYKDLVHLTHTMRIIHPKEIDEWVFQGKLNWLEAKHTVDMLNGLKPKQAIIDCPARNLEEYKEFIQQQVKAKLLVMYRADANYPVVAAASIIAKVTRDRIIEDIKKKTGFDFGSGYLTDPKTQEFMKTMKPDFPHVRKSWKTYNELLAKRGQKQLF
ncbi:MAG: ribonuclease HII [Candidatus Thorarchaeota archaeon]